MINLEEPLVVGICGEIASGKTSVAELIVPKGRLNDITMLNNFNIRFDHTILARPMYSMYNIKSVIKGYAEESRKKYGLLNILLDLFGSELFIGSGPTFDELIEMVNEFYHYPTEADVKPREFLQLVGDRCRHFEPDCFANRTVRKIKELTTPKSDDYIDVVIVSDVRLENEARILSKFGDNFFLFRFDVDETTQKERLLDRDGYIPKRSSMKHQSELERDQYIDLVNCELDSSNLSLSEQTNIVLENITEWISTNA